MGNVDVGALILYFIALILSLSVHESGHAIASNYFGDDLAKSMGRISLNPLAHIDPLGTIVIPLFSFISGAALIGWAKPVPVNPLNWKNKRVANFWVSIAGILGNLALALIAGLLIRALHALGQLSILVSGADFQLSPPGPGGFMDPISQLLQIFFTLNISLAIFNFIPVPPLDGSNILASFLPDSFSDAIGALNQYGWILLMIIVSVGVLAPIYGFIMPVALDLLVIGLQAN